MQEDLFIASVAYWLAVAAFLFIISRRLSRVSSKISDLERRLSKEK